MCIDPSLGSHRICQPCPDQTVDGTVLPWHQVPIRVRAECGTGVTLAAATRWLIVEAFGFSLRTSSGGGAA